MKGVAQGTFSITRSANFAEAVGNQSILVEDATKPDYFVQGSLTIQNQKVS